MGIKLSQNLFGGIQDIIGQCFLSHWRTDGTTLSRKVQNKIWKIWHGQWKIKHWIQYDTVKSWHPQLLMIGSTKFHTVHFMVYFFRMMVAIYQLQRQVTGRHSVQLDAATHHGLALAMRNSPEQSLLLWKMLIHIGWIEYEFYRFYSICWILIYYHTSVYYIYMCVYIYYIIMNHICLLHLITRNIHPTRIGHTLQFDQEIECFIQEIECVSLTFLRCHWFIKLVFKQILNRIPHCCGSSIISQPFFLDGECISIRSQQAII